MLVKFQNYYLKLNLFIQQAFEYLLCMVAGMNTIQTKETYQFLTQWHSL